MWEIFTYYSNVLIQITSITKRIDNFSIFDRRKFKRFIIIGLEWWENIKINGVRWLEKLYSIRYTVHVAVNLLSSLIKRNLKFKIERNASDNITMLWTSYSILSFSSVESSFEWLIYDAKIILARRLFIVSIILCLSSSIGKQTQHGSVWNARY